MASTPLAAAADREGGQPHCLHYAAGDAVAGGHPASPPAEHEQPVKASSSPPPPPLATFNPFPSPLPAEKLSSPKPPPVQVPPPQFEKAEVRPDGSVLAMFWYSVARVQEAHASLDEYISNWFGLDQSKYQWALNDYYESTGKEMDSGKAGKQKEFSSKMQV
ncbi:hypothetical protein GUJ93_ZPchr0004g39702 [Zizania palustris]|uniref:Uncharacterized protein n=1 Tax=Zizania palustris TaxID=103762 RepID=A0A8J5VEY0_ZIZPA|nr:hypothetical protein GUJ93_ZPchr0004g39702 [Zizania palustris]